MLCMWVFCVLLQWVRVKKRKREGRRLHFWNISRWATDKTLKNKTNKKIKNLKQQGKEKKEKEDNINHLRDSCTACTLCWTCSVWILLFLLYPLFHLTTEQFFYLQWPNQSWALKLSQHCWALSKITFSPAFPARACAAAGLLYLFPFHPVSSRFALHVRVACMGKPGSLFVSAVGARCCRSPSL